MEIPKNYSNYYCEERAPVPAARSTTTTATNQAPAAATGTQQQQPPTKALDGAFSTRRHREMGQGGINPADLLPKLYHLSKEQSKAYAINTLQQHYNSVFQKRNHRRYKVYINYWDKKETFLVRIEKNTLREVRSKLPIKGEYRLFFIHPGNECEELEDNEAQLPYHEKDGVFNIYCRVFSK